MDLSTWPQCNQCHAYFSPGPLRGPVLPGAVVPDGFRPGGSLCQDCRPARYKLSDVWGLLVPVTPDRPTATKGKSHAQ